jgi:hypothetical protein
LVSAGDVFGAVPGVINVAVDQRSGAGGVRASAVSVEQNATSKVPALAAIIAGDDPAAAMAALTQVDVAYRADHGQRARGATAFTVDSEEKLAWLTNYVWGDAGHAYVARDDQQFLPASSTP